MAQPSLISADASHSIMLSETVQVSSADIVSRTVLQTPELRIVLFAFDAGQELAQHTSRRRAMVQVLSGMCDFFFSGAWHRLECGTLLHLPPGHPHAVRASAGAFTMLLTLAVESSTASSQSCVKDPITSS